MPARGKCAQQLQIFGNIGAPDFGDDDVGLSADGDGPVNERGVKAALASELPERGNADVFFVPAVAVVILSEGIPGGICDDSVRAGIYSGHHGGVRRIGDGGHYGLDAVARCAIANDFAKRGDFEAVRVGICVGFGLHSVDGDDDDVLDGFGGG